MPIDIEVWAALAAALLQGLAILRDQRAQNRQQVDEALIAKYRAGWEEGKAAFDETFGSPTKVAELTAESFFAFLNQIDAHTNAESGLFRLGPGTPAPNSSPS